MSTQTTTTKKTNTKFFKSVMQELKKVNWPNRKELSTYIVVVLTMCGISAAVLGAFDTVFRAAVTFIINFGN